MCFILFTLFSNTLVVKAANNSNNTFTITTSVYPNATEGTTFGTITSNSGGGYIRDGTGSISISGGGGSINTNSHEGYTYHIKVPVIYHTDWSNLGTTGDYYGNVTNYFYLVPTNFSITNNIGTITNLTIYTDDGHLLRRNDTDASNVKPFFRKGTELAGAYKYEASIPLIVEFDFAYEQQQTIGVTSSPLDRIDLTTTINMSMYGRLASDNEIELIKTQVTDSGTQSKLDDLNNSSEAIEESVTSDTGGGILATIKNFFGSFFQNVFDTLVSVFVPEDGFFSDWFNRLNTLLSEKLGMLYAPFDLLITTLNAIMNADTTDSGIPFPGIQWEDTWLVEPFTFYFSSLGDTFTDLQGYVYFGTDTVLLFAFLHLLQSKIRLILEGHESG